MLVCTIFFLFTFEPFFQNDGTKKSKRWDHGSLHGLACWCCRCDTAGTIKQISEEKLGRTNSPNIATKEIHAYLLFSMALLDLLLQYALLCDPSRVHCMFWQNSFSRTAFLRLSPVYMQPCVCLPGCHWRTITGWHTGSHHKWQCQNKKSSLISPERLRADVQATTTCKLMRKDMDSRLAASAARSAAVCWRCQASCRPCPLMQRCLGSTQQVHRCARWNAEIPRANFLAKSSSRKWRHGWTIRCGRIVHATFWCCLFKICWIAYIKFRRNLRALSHHCRGHIWPKQMRHPLAFLHESIWWNVWKRAWDLCF